LFEREKQRIFIICLDRYLNQIFNLTQAIYFLI
jgi:hypothetical protein